MRHEGAQRLIVEINRNGGRIGGIGAEFEVGVERQPAVVAVSKFGRAGFRAAFHGFALRGDAAPVEAVEKRVLLNHNFERASFAGDVCNGGVVGRTFHAVYLSDFSSVERDDVAVGNFLRAVGYFQLCLSCGNRQKAEQREGKDFLHNSVLFR